MPRSGLFLDGNCQPMKIDYVCSSGCCHVQATKLPSKRGGEHWEVLYNGQETTVTRLAEEIGLTVYALRARMQRRSGCLRVPKRPRRRQSETHPIEGIIRIGVKGWGCRV